MKRFTMFTCLSLALVFAAAAVVAGESDDYLRYRYADGKYAGVTTGFPIWAGKAAADTVYLIGGPDAESGKFEDEFGAPDLQGWTSIDKTARTEQLWNCDTYNAANLDPLTVPNHAWWCGTFFDDDCGTGDNFGYGNNWEEYLAFYGTVPNPSQSITVTVTAMLNYDNELNYDYLYLQYETIAGWIDAETYNGTLSDVVVNSNFTLTPADYVGGGGNEVHIRWRFTSDGGWSDEDCSFTGMGAAQIDLINVFGDQGGSPFQFGSEEDCEGPTQWVLEFPDGVGDYMQVWPLLNEIDPCRSNPTPQPAAVDDGVIVPGTGGYLCTTWCYGPGGYIVNPEGGLAGQDFHIDNEIWSPILEWPAGSYDGAMYHFDVYRHEPLSSVSPGIFYVWHVRSVDSGNAADVLDAGWTDRNFVYYGGPDFIRVQRADRNNVTDLMVPGRTHVQLALGVYELGWVWGFIGTDGAPAPYFDNVAFKVFEFAGPGISTRDIDIFNDNLPAIGTIDYANLGENSVRLDMANNISPSAHLRNDPGDSIYADVVAVRTGSMLNDRPKLYYKLFANPVFDAFRTSGLPNEGWVYGDSTYATSGSIIGDRWNFDLPDTGFFFPGDLLRYYIEGQDNAGGDIGTTLMPSDTTGFSYAPGMDGYVSLDYPNFWTVRALPTLFSGAEGDHPDILWMNDFADRGGENEWVGAFNNLGYQEGTDYDQYYTNGPSSGVGNGIGGRGSATQLKDYEVILYTAGDLSAFTISNGDFLNDAGDDLGVLDSWLRLGGKDMLLTGDDLVFDLTQNAGTNGLQFVNNWIGVNFIAQDLNPLIDGQAAPTVAAVGGNSVFLGITQWIAYGGCIGFNTFDAVETQTGVEKLAEFLTPEGASGQYSYAAATKKVSGTYSANVIYAPYDLMFIYTDDSVPGDGTALPARAKFLQEVLFSFGQIGSSPTVPVPDAGVFSVKNYPNPFNPVTKIEFNMPRRGELSVKIFNVRGELVKTLIEDVQPAGSGYVIWDGTNNGGDAVASGVYFYETVAFGKATVNKMALVK